jgi:Protein of unknown function (DUF664)
MIVAMATARRADMFTADGKPSDDDPREHGPTLVEEYARHMGHADLLRERIDGRLGQ